MRNTKKKTRTATRCYYVSSAQRYLEITRSRLPDNNIVTLVALLVHIVHLVHVVRVTRVAHVIHIVHAINVVIVMLNISVDVCLYLT